VAASSMRDQATVRSPLSMTACGSTDQIICMNTEKRSAKLLDGTMRDYVVICSCGYEACRHTLGQAASDLLRHRDENPGPDHTATLVNRGRNTARKGASLPTASSRAR